MQRNWSKLLWAGIIILAIFTILYFGYCTGAWGKRDGWLHYRFQCSCPRYMENIRVRKVYSEHAEIMFPACGPEIGPIPSPSGRKVAVINFEEPNRSYVWFLQTDERMPFSLLRSTVDWLTDDLLLVRWGPDMNVVDLDARAEYSLPVRADVRLGSEKIAPAVLSALRKARYVILSYGGVAAISPHALASPEHSFVIRYDVSVERMKRFLREQDIHYLDYTDRSGTDVLLASKSQKYGVERGDLYADVASPDGRFFYRESFYVPYEDGIYLVETGEQIVDWNPNWEPVDWVHDGVIIHPGGGALIDTWLLEYHIGLGGISEPWLKLRVPSEYAVSDERTVDVSDRLPITFQMLVCFGVALIVAGGIQMLRQRKRRLSERSETQ